MAAARSGLKVCGLRAEVGDPYTDRQLTPTRRADGPSACPGNSLHEPGTRRRERRFLGTWSKPKNPFACGTQATPVFCGRSGSEMSWTCPCAERRTGAVCRKAYGCPQQCGRRGRGVSPSRSARPLGSERQQTTGEPWSRTKPGAMTRVWSSYARARRCSKSEAGGCLTIE